MTIVRTIGCGIVQPTAVHDRPMYLMTIVRTIGCGIVVMLGACGFSVSTETNSPDAGPNRTGPSADAGDNCLGPSGWTVCPHMPIDLQQITGNIDTDASPYCSTAQLDGWPAPPLQPAACFVVGRTLILTDTTASGSRPLVFVAIETITINGVVDVASHRAGSHGPASPASQCLPFVKAAAKSDNGGGGGAGGSFGTAGGVGGKGNQDVAAGEPAPADSVPSTQLRGGCAGQVGGQMGGVPGQGGGGIYLVAGISITGTGTINASGSGGSQAGSFSGGSGGGTGGMIVLSAPVISLGGAVANGGGGASGASNNTSSPGADVDPLTPTAPALGGVDHGTGGKGGNGSFMTAPAVSGTAVASDRGGGGGGGGGGEIRSNLTLGFPSSPPATIVP